MNSGRIVSIEFSASIGKICIISFGDLISYTYRFPTLSRSRLASFRLARGVSILHTGGLDIVTFYLGLLRCICE